MKTLEAPQGGHYPDAWLPEAERLLWWDDASYIRYQSEDPYAQYESWTDEDWDDFNAAALEEATRPNTEADWPEHRDFLNAQDLDREAIEAELNAPSCPHGLSSWLCADPVSHYPVGL